MLSYYSTSEAVLGTIECILKAGSPSAPRGKPTLELVNHIFVVADPGDEPIVSRCAARNRVMAEYLADEFRLFDSFAYDAASFAARAKLWDAVKNPDGTVNSAYGHVIFGMQRCREGFTSYERFSQWEWARRSLLRDPDSRQAFIRVGFDGAQWIGVKDLPCTHHLQFQARDGALHLTAVMRSNDVTRGLPYDMPYFCRLQRRMIRELGYGGLALRLGTYTHFAHSMHLYESEREKAYSMIGRV